MVWSRMVPNDVLQWLCSSAIIPRSRLVSPHEAGHEGDQRQPKDGHSGLLQPLVPEPHPGRILSLDQPLWRPDLSGLLTCGGLPGDRLLDALSATAAAPSRWAARGGLFVLLPYHRQRLPPRHRARQPAARRPDRGLSANGG